MKFREICSSSSSLLCFHPLPCFRDYVKYAFPGPASVSLARGQSPRSQTVADQTMSSTVECRTSIASQRECVTAYEDAREQPGADGLPSPWKDDQSINTALLQTEDVARLFRGASQISWSLCAPARYFRDQDVQLSDPMILLKPRLVLLSAAAMSLKDLANGRNRTPRLTLESRRWDC